MNRRSCKVHRNAFNAIFIRVLICFLTTSPATSDSVVQACASYCAPAAGALACCWGVIFLPSLLKRTRGGGARLRRPSRDRTRTIFPWMAQLTQYWSFKYILGTVYSAKTEASEISRIAADSTMLRIVNLLIALSFGVQRLQFEQRMGLT